MIVCNDNNNQCSLTVLTNSSLISNPRGYEILTFLINAESWHLVILHKVVFVASAEDQGWDPE